jgi:transposase-like protein
MRAKEGTVMAVKLFSDGEILELKASRYVVEATERFVYFTAEFKQLFYEGYRSGKKLKRIISELGIDPEILGMSRIYGLRGHILQEVKRGKGFSDLRNSPFKDRASELSPEEKIARLEHELAYMRQELAFVKKIVAANQDAAKQ